MKFELGPELEEFRREVRSFIRDNLPADIAFRVRRTPNVYNEQDSLRWRRILHEKRGWSMPHWPVEYGGTGWTAMQLFIFEDESHRAHAPMFPWQQSHMLGPVLYTFGTDAQKKKFLPAILRGDYHWAQGFSEPGAGSDLASLRTTAVREGERYIVNGQKLWTSGAAHADWIFCLVKTDTTVKPQRGISFLLIDLRSPGITVRPIPQMDCQAHLCEVYFDNVSVPAENLVGEPGTGWGYAKFLLEHERTESSFVYWNKRELEKVKAMAAQERIDGTRVIDQPLFRSRLARVEAEVMGLEWSVLRVLAHEKTPYHDMAVASCLKVRGAELQQRITELQFEVMGERGLRRFDTEQAWDFQADEERWPERIMGTMNTALFSRAATVYGGTKQVQYTLLAKLAFGL